MRFACKLDESPWHRCDSPQSFSNLTEASHRFAVRARDRAGNVDGTPAVMRWVVDRTPPDTVIQGQGQRGILELRFPFEGKYMFHAHVSEFAELGWMGFFEVV